jgi:hypothetical protein
MATYRCNFLVKGKVFCFVDLDGETDDQAIEKMRRKCSDLGHPSFELWRANVLVYSKGRKVTMTSSTAAIHVESRDGDPSVGRA